MALLGTISASSRFICLLSLDVLGSSSCSSAILIELLRLRREGLLDDRFNRRRCCSVKALLLLIAVSVAAAVVVVAAVASVADGATPSVVVASVVVVVDSHFVLCNILGQ